MKFNSNIIPVKKLKEMGMNFEAYESIGILKFKNGFVIEGVIKIYEFGYKLSEDGLYALVFKVEDNEEVESYTPLETTKFHEYNEKIKEIKQLRKNRYT